MSREIKFRAWDYYAGTMLYSDGRENECYEDDEYVFQVGIDRIELITLQLIDTLEDGEHVQRHEFRPTKCEIMQYTGLKDKNGVEIYEGDVVSFTTYSYIEPLTGGNAEIVCDSTSGCFKFKEVHPKLCYRTLHELCEEAYVYELEVIGTIHDKEASE